MNARQKNVFDALKQGKRNWEGRLFSNLSVLGCYDGRTVNALVRKGHLRIHLPDHEDVGLCGYTLHA